MGEPPKKLKDGNGNIVFVDDITWRTYWQLRNSYVFCGLPVRYPPKKKRSLWEKFLKQS